MAVQKLTKAPIKAPPKKLVPPPPSVPTKLGPRAADLNQQAAAITPPPKIKPVIKGLPNKIMPVDDKPSYTVPCANGAYDVKKGENEVIISSASSSGRQELDRVCGEKGLIWGIVGTSLICPGAGKPAKVKLTLVIGSKWEFETSDEVGYPQACEDALLGIAAELESEG